MRIINTIKNSAYAIFSYLLLAMLALLVRKVFLNSLPLELLGYEGLFGNVFALLALADLGIESLILYRLFPAFAQNNKNEINKTMAVYKLLYKYIGIAILSIGLILVPLLKYIISGNELDWSYVYLIYFVQLGATLCTYFLAYKRLMFTVSQQEFECTKVDTIISLIFNIVKIIILVLLKSYILYLLCNLAINLFSNIIVSNKVNKRFVFFDSNQNVGLKDIKELGIGKEIKDNLVQKVSGTIYGGTDNILISILLGINNVGLVSNYSLIGGYVTNFLTKLLKPFQMSIGNHVYSSEDESGYLLFRMFDLISFFVASIVATCFLCVFNPFIEIWLGQDFLLSQLFVVAFSLNQYVMWNHQFLCFYRYSFGRYDLDKYFIFVAAITNVVLSIVFCKALGVAGIMIGTVVGQLGFWIGRVKVVYTLYIKRESVFRYIIRQFVRFGVLTVEMYVSWRICAQISVNVFGIVGRLCVCILFTTMLNIVLFWHASEMTSIKTYLKKSFSAIKMRGMSK